MIKEIYNCDTCKKEINPTKPHIMSTGIGYYVGIGEAYDTTRGGYRTWERFQITDSNSQSHFCQFKCYVKKLEQLHAETELRLMQK